MSKISKYIYINYIYCLYIEKRKIDCFAEAEKQNWNGTKIKKEI